jgi:hypothetical protein
MVLFVSKIARTIIGIDSGLSTKESYSSKKIVITFNVINIEINLDKRKAKNICQKQIS